jgi:hypothetical protein
VIFRWKNYLRAINNKSGAKRYIGRTKNMSNNSKTPANGGAAAEKNTTGQIIVATVPKAAPATETPKPKAEEKPKAKNTQQLFEKAKRLTNCVEKIKSLQDAATELDSINMDKPSGKGSLEISDGLNSFSTENVNLLNDVQQYLAKRIEIRTDELEQELAEIERS